MIDRLEKPHIGRSLGQTLPVLPFIKFAESGILLADRPPPAWVGHVPVDRIIQRCPAISRGLPTQFFSNPRSIDAISTVVTGPVLDMPNQ